MAAEEGDPDPGPGLSRLAEQRPVGPALCGGQSRGNVQQLPGELLLSGFLQLPGINPHHHWDLRPGTLPQGTEPRPPCAWHTAGASQEAPHPSPAFRQPPPAPAPPAQDLLEVERESGAPRPPASPRCPASSARPAAGTEGGHRLVLAERLQALELYWEISQWDRHGCRRKTLLRSQNSH